MLASRTICSRVLAGVTVPVNVTSPVNVSSAMGELTVIVAGGGGGVVVCPVARAMITDFAGRIIVVIPFGPTVGAGGLRSSWGTSSVLPAGGVVALLAPTPRRL